MSATTVKRSDATKNALLGAARDEFAEYGLAGARVDRIAEAAGVNKERIYGLFGNKDKLFDLILVDAMREFVEVARPMPESDPGGYVSRVFDYHDKHPQLLRMLLWEALQRGGDDVHDVDGWRAQHYERKFDSAITQFGVDAEHAGYVLLALCGLCNWSLAVPQTTKLLLGDAAEDKQATKRFLIEFARTALRNHFSAQGIGAEPTAEDLVNQLTGAPNHAGASDTADVPRESVVAEPTSGAHEGDRVDAAAERLRRARAAAEEARAELDAELRAAHAAGAGANALARKVDGTLSRPVVLKLLANNAG
ncbi:TetR/AcrR family transcriptional regulator [Nocardia callitridis]|uniref:HTH tetR-type domain-containing protein n=1 Tax=Nocardia callitridis TaxID=648753 RepID=A0ABP9K0N0_9NOCA